MVSAAPGEHEGHFREAWQVECCHDAILRSSRAWTALGAFLPRAVAALPFPERHRWNGSFVSFRFFFPSFTGRAGNSRVLLLCGRVPEALRVGSHGPVQNRKSSGSCPGHEGFRDEDGEAHTEIAPELDPLATRDLGTKRPLSVPCSASAARLVEASFYDAVRCGTETLEVLLVQSQRFGSRNRSPNSVGHFGGYHEVQPVSFNILQTYPPHDASRFINIRTVTWRI